MERILTETFKGYVGTIKIFSPYPEAIQRRIDAIRAKFGGSVCGCPSTFDGQSYDMYCYVLPDWHTFDGQDSKLVYHSFNNKRNHA